MVLNHHCLPIHDMRRLLLLLLPLAFSVHTGLAQAPKAPRVNTEVPFAISESAPQGGFGTQTRGGLDGRIVKVTNLNVIVGRARCAWLWRR